MRAASLQGRYSDHRDPVPPPQAMMTACHESPTAKAARGRRLRWFRRLCVGGIFAIWCVGMYHVVGHVRKTHALRAVVKPVVPQEPVDLVGELLAAVAIYGKDIVTSTEPLGRNMGPDTTAVHMRMRNIPVLRDLPNRARDALLVVVVLRDHEPWGRDRSVVDFFKLLSTITHPKAKTSLTVLASDRNEFHRVWTAMENHIKAYAQFALLFRDDHDEKGGSNTLKKTQRRKIARYRNFALLATLETWHQHIVWLDADVVEIPPVLVSKMIQSGRDIVEPVCYQASADQRGKATTDPTGGAGDYVPLATATGSMLYVQADIHRKGVLFPQSDAVGDEHDGDRRDTIDSEGLCVEGRFLGYQCWSAVHDVIQCSARA